ncbi:MAG: zf-HC2 domain-containing protein [Planctomycetota bacterium]
MSCEGYGLLISKWVDGEAKADDARRAEAHVASCAPCRKLADEFRRNAGLLEAALGPEPFGHRIAGGVFGSLARREALWRWGARLGAAAAIILSVLLLRADRNADQKRFHDQITAALRVVEQMQSLLDKAHSSETVARETIVVPWPYEKTEGSPVGDQELPRAVAAGNPADPRPALPEKHPGTVAQDTIDASSDWETGNVTLAWNTDKLVFASLARPEVPVAYLVFRREDGTQEWGAPINQGVLFEPKFEDVTARGLTTYEYRFAALFGGYRHDSEDIARLKTPADLRVEFIGLFPTGFRFDVHVRVTGKWRSEIFIVNSGETIGDTRNGVDFSTGVIFRKAERLNRPGTQEFRQCATIETSSGRLFLWSGFSAVGSRDGLVDDERPR